jgi:predicted DNA binding protein
MSSTQEEPYQISLEINNDRCKLLKTFKNIGIPRFKVIDIREGDEGITRHLVRLSTEQIHKIPEKILKKIQKTYPLQKDASAWFETEGCEICNTIVTKGSFLISGRNIQGSTIVYNFITPNFEAFKKIISTLEEHNLEPKILEVKKHKAKGLLTEKQERALWIALRMGFFEYPRKINTIELSQKLGIAPSTLSEIKRRGIRRLLEHHFET